MDGFRFRMDGGGMQEGGQRRPQVELIGSINSPDPMVQYGALQMLCDQLTMSSFVSPSILATIPMLMPSLLRCITASPMPEVSISAARALTYILDAFPRTMDAVALPAGAVEVLLGHLRSIEDVELSEQCITCLEIVTRGQVGCREVLRTGGVEALLGFADFFTLHKQRQIWTILQRLVQGIDESTFRHVEPSLLTIRLSMTNSDADIRQKAILVLSLIVEGVRTDETSVNVAFGDSGDRIAGLLHDRDVNDDTLSSALSLLSCGVRHSAAIAAVTIRGGQLTTLLTLLKPPVVTASLGEVDFPASPASGQHSPNLTVNDAVAVVESGDASPSSMLPPPGESAARATGLTAHQRTILCGLLASLLIPYRGGLASQLERLEAITQRPALLGNPAAGEESTGGGGEEEDNEEEADDDYVTTEDEEDDVNDVFAAQAAEEANHAALAEQRQRLTVERGLRLQTRAVDARCRSSGFMCDGCGKACTPGDWYRCNDCDDRDYCAACLLQEYKNDHNGQHSYTDMELVLGATARNKAKRDLFQKAPELLDLVLEAVPTVAQVCISSELVSVRAACLEFLVSAVDMATPEQLLGGDVPEAELGDVLNHNLRSSELLCNALAVTLADRLLAKLASTYQVQFVREGVRMGLQLLKQRCRVKGKVSLAANERAELTRSSIGWRTIIGVEAAALLHRYLASTDEQSTEALRRIVAELKQDRLVTAAELLRTVLEGDATAFEFYSSGIVRELRSCLTRTGNVFAVMQLVSTLSCTVGGSPSGRSPYLGPASNTSMPRQPPSTNSTPMMSPRMGGGNALSRFVHHLQTVLTLLDTFTVPHYSYVSGVHKYFVVCFEPHRPSVAVPGDTTLSARRESRGQPESGRAAAPRQSIKARIRPLSSVNAMTQVLQREVLQRDSENDDEESANQDTEEVTDVLPRLHPELLPSNHPTSRSTATPSQSTSGPSHETNVWIRYGTHVLPLSMTMLQVMDLLVLPAAAAAEEEKENAVSTAAAEGAASSLQAAVESPAQRQSSGTNRRQSAASKSSPRAHQRRVVPRDMTEIPGNSLQRPVMLYYSTTPYDSDYYRFYDVPNGFPPSGKSQEKLHVRLPSKDCKPRAVREVERSLAMEFPYSQEILSESQREMVGLLRILHAVVSNWSSLLPYLRKQHENRSSDPNAGTMLKEVKAESILNVFAPSIAVTEFQHVKLNSKAVQQCSELLLAGQQRGTWAVKLALDCGFLFSFATRKFLFDVGFTSTDRCLVRMRRYRELFDLHDHRISSEQMRHIFGQLPKESKRVWREDVLECAKKVLSSQEPKTRNMTWSFQFYNENGWGEGPTREFYTLVAQRLRGRDLGLWRDGNEADKDTEYDANLGLYPKPCSRGSAESKHLVFFFRLIGRFIGRALLDEHVPGLPLSAVLLRLLRGDVCGVYDLQDISEEVGRLVLALAEAAAQKAVEVHLPSQKTPIPILDLALDFTVPGDDAAELVSNGTSTPVTPANAMTYCDAVVDFLLNNGVSAAVQAMREGFNWYMPLVSLQMLTVEELYQLIAGHEKAITREEFAQYSEANYGYTLNCKHVQWLFDILASFSIEEQKLFFLFVTGAAHLPVGGLARLRPALTVVRKTSETPSISESDLLPSAMTCQNYLKLPQYTTKEEMEKKLRFAMTEGNGAFLLS